MSLAQVPLEHPVLTVIAFALVMLLGATYWRWLGYM